MSDRRHTPRSPLPEGYQYGDARPERWMCRMTGIGMMHMTEAGASVCNCGQPAGAWRAPHENAAAQLERKGNRLVDTPQWLIDDTARKLKGLLSQRTGDETL